MKIKKNILESVVARLWKREIDLYSACVELGLDFNNVAKEANLDDYAIEVTKKWSQFLYCNQKT